MTDATATAIPHDAHGDVGVTAHHTPSDGHYVRVALFLAVATALEVILSYTALHGIALLVPLLVVMAIKFVIVASHFMHLRFDDKLLSKIFYTGLLLATGVYIAALSSLHVFAGK
ncbi:MAG: hypothetical protein JWN46_3606 [Acidimicrobiales bacterium]|nr:hypothetical protein [Acidimicrobiales bacterium]